ncbi:MAG: flagellar hook-length control protein FliK [Xanthobacteraceae bacterium]
MRVVVIPALLLPNTSAAAAPSLQLGAIVNGKVLQTLVDGRIRIMLVNTILDLVDPGNLVPGTTLRLQVAGDASALKFVVLDQVPPENAAGATLAAIASAPGAGAAAAADTASAQKASAPGGVAQPTEPAAALTAAVATAVTRQSSLAPLFADAALAATLEQLPEPVRDAAGQLLALRPPLDENLSAAVVKQAFTSSGLLLETRLALASQGLAPPPSASDDLKAALSALRGLLAGYLDTADLTPAEPSPSNGIPASAPPAAEEPSAAPTAASPDRTAPQTVQPASASPIAAAPAPTDAAPAATPEPLPEPASDAAGRPLASPAPLGENLAADAEHSLASARPLPATRLGAESLAPLQPNAPEELAAALGVVRSTLARTIEPHEAAPVASGLADATPASVSQSVMRPAAQAAPPPPPYRGALPTAQAAVAPSIRTDNAPRDVAQVLMGEVDGALSRHVLLQVASLPQRTDGTAARWAFEVPFALPQGTTIAQLEIARDGRQGAPEHAAKPVWRARFSIDLEPIGPVHALITLNVTPNAARNGGRTAVTLWAERPDTSAQLRAHVGGLAQSLRGAELDPGEVLVRDGAPPRPRGALPAGHFLDRAT